MEKIVIVTGMLAAPIIKNICKKYRNVDVIVLPSQVAAFMSPNYIYNHLKNLKLKDCLVLVPGLISGDFKNIGKKLGLDVKKGPDFAPELPLVLENQVKLSSKTSASQFLKKLLLKQVREILAKEKGRKDNLGFDIKGRYIGRGLFPHILAEIVHANKLSEIALEEKVIDFIHKGADIIDIGMTAGAPDPVSVKKIIRLIHKITDIPLSIDSSSVSEIKAAIDIGIDLILSIDARNIGKLAKFARDIPCVITPIQENGTYPFESSLRVKSIDANIKKAKKFGYKKIIVDLILDPFSGLINSLEAHTIFAKKSSLPLFFGIGNITELTDADSVGINLILTQLGVELGVSILFTTEASVKTENVIKELSIARAMALVSKKKKQPMKNLGLDLLILKNKVKIETDYTPSSKEIMIAKYKPKFERDPAGDFNIFLDRKNKQIIVIHTKNDQHKIIRGNSAKELYKWMIKAQLVSKLDHASYLGYELAKAEIALNSGKFYVQDRLLFPRQEIEI